VAAVAAAADSELSANVSSIETRIRACAMFKKYQIFCLKTCLNPTKSWTIVRSDFDRRSTAILEKIFRIKHVDFESSIRYSVVVDRVTSLRNVSTGRNE
tara:strand:- start:1058 stop:1354 length:297 start_codon:yes stop_codon:yes gene_type:complete